MDIKILIVEDDKLQLYLVKEYIVSLKLHYKFFYANSYDEAISLLNEYRFSLVLTDYKLNQNKTCFQLIPYFNNTPFIVFTAHGNEFIAADALNYNAIAYIIKQSDLSHLNTVGVFIEEALRQKYYRERLELYRSAIENIKDGIFIVNSANKIIYVNTAIESLYDYKDFELINADASVLWQNNNDFKKGSFKNLNERHVRKDGSLFIAELTCCIIENNEYYAVYTVNDGTKKNELIDSMKQVNKNKTEFCGLLSHDLRGLFTQVSLGLDVLEELIDSEHTDTEKLKSHIQTIQKSSNTVQECFFKITDWVKSDLGIVEPNFETVNFTDIVEKVCSLYELVAQQKEIILMNTVPKDTCVSADSHIIEVVLRNMVQNAIKFSNIGETVTIMLSHETELEVHIAVSDTGTGISKEKLSILLDPNQQNPPTKGTTGEKGSGLGIKICQNFAALNQGRFWAESEDGVGSTFYFSLKK